VDRILRGEKPGDLVNEAFPTIALRYSLRAVQ
jgi:hypothetical protein